MQNIFKIFHRFVSPKITGELQEQNKKEAEARGWYTTKQILECRPGAPEDPDPEWTVCVSGPHFTFSPFPSKESAVNFIRRWVRDSIEQLRKPSQSADALFDLWFAFGQTGEIVGDDYSILSEIDTFIEEPATETERDWKSFLQKMGAESFGEEQKAKRMSETYTVIASQNGEASGDIRRVEGFPTLELAKEYIRRYVSDSVESLRQPEMPIDDLKKQWEQHGANAEVPGACSGSDFINGILLFPAERQNRDWKAIEKQLGEKDPYPPEKPVSQTSLTDEQDGSPYKGIYAITQHPDHPADLSGGLKLEKPDVFIPWEVTQKTLKQLLNKHGLKQISPNGYTLHCVFWGEKLELGFQFGKDGRGAGHEERGFWQVYFRKGHSKDFVEKYWWFQKYLELNLGKPEMQWPPNPDRYNLPHHRWDLRHVCVEHWVSERFGFERHLDFSKTYEGGEDALFMECLKHFLTDASLSDKPLFSFVLGAPCSGKSTYIKKELLHNHVWVDAAEIFLFLNSGSRSKFSKIMKYPMNHIGRRILQRAFAEKRNVVMEFWPEDARVFDLLTSSISRIGYRVNVHDLDCKKLTSIKRNKERENNNISSYFTMQFHLQWLFDELGIKIG